MEARQGVTRTLGKIGPEAAKPVPALGKVVEDEWRGARVQAIIALGEIEPEAQEAVPALIQVLEDEDADVHGAASGALEAITDQDFGEDADRWQEWWEEQQ